MSDAAIAAVAAMSNARAASAASAAASAPLQPAVTVEERLEVRAAIAEAYRKNCAGVEDAIALAAAVEEEMLLACEPSRMLYIKASIGWGGRLAAKRKQLGMGPAPSEEEEGSGKRQRR